MRRLGYFFNVRVLTSAESPWSNGTCERLNGDLVKKILLDGGDIEIALEWAVSGRNALQNFPVFNKSASDWIKSCDSRNI